jgi:hypothetical protein
LEDITPNATGINYKSRYSSVILTQQDAANIVQNNTSNKSNIKNAL